MKLFKVFDSENNEIGWAYLHARGKLILHTDMDSYPAGTRLMIDEHDIIKPEETHQLNQLLKQEKEQAASIEERQQLAKLNSYIGEVVKLADKKGVVIGANKDTKLLIVKFGNYTREWNIPTVELHLI